MAAQPEADGGDNAERVAHQNHILSSDFLQVHADQRGHQEVGNLEHSQDNTDFAAIDPRVILSRVCREESCEVHVERLEDPESEE